MRTAIAAIVLLGCGVEGAVEQVEFGPECEAGDLRCQTGGLDSPMALGAVVALDVVPTLPGAGAPPITLEVANPDVIKVSGHELLAVSPGRTALLAKTDGDLVLDLTHVWVRAPTRVALRRPELGVGDTVEDAIELLPGDEMQLDIVTYADGVRLSGRVEGTWSSSSSAITILQNGSIGSRRLSAREPGNATIAVQLEGTSASIDIEVLP